MKVAATLEMDAAVPDRVLDIVAAIPGLAVRRSHASLLRVDDESYPLVVFPGVDPYARAMTPTLIELAGPNRLPLVVAERLLPNVRLEGVLASSLAKRAPGYVSLGFPDPR